MADYTKRINFLKGLVQSATLNNPIEKVIEKYTNQGYK